MCSIFNSVPSQRTVVGTMEVSIFIPGLEEGDYALLSKTVQKCAEGKALKKILTQTKRLFHHNLEGRLLSLLVLKQAHVSSPLFKEKKFLISYLQESKLLINGFYNELKDYPPSVETPLAVITADCKERLSLILSEACGCIQCTTVISKILSSEMGRPLHVLTHQKHCPAQNILNFVYNQMIVGGSLVDPEIVLPDLIVQEDLFTHQLYEYRKELSLLTTCFYLAWFYMFMELYLVEDIKYLEYLILEDKENIPLTSQNVIELWEFVLHHAIPQGSDSSHSFPLSRDIVDMECVREITDEIDGPIPRPIKKRAYSRMASCFCKNRFDVFPEIPNEGVSDKRKSKESTNNSYIPPPVSTSSPKLQRGLSYVSPPRSPDEESCTSDNFEIIFEEDTDEPNFLPIEEFDRLLHISSSSLSPEIKQTTFMPDEVEDKGDDSSPESPPDSPKCECSSPIPDVTHQDNDLTDIDSSPIGPDLSCIYFREDV
nr:MAG: hypothetical protein ADFBMEEK_00036 [Peromyscus leucopus gammaherpesvirus]